VSASADKALWKDLSTKPASHEMLLCCFMLVSSGNSLRSKHSLPLIGWEAFTPPFHLHAGRYTLLEAESDSPVPEVEALSSRPGESRGPPIPTAAPFSSPLVASTKKERSRLTERLSPSQGRSAAQSHSNVRGTRSGLLSSLPGIHDMLLPLPLLPSESG
jgi:hypothetical protein